VRQFLAGFKVGLVAGLIVAYIGAVVSPMLWLSLVALWVLWPFLKLAKFVVKGVISNARGVNERNSVVRGTSA